jgi:hypothetical protein
MEQRARERRAAGAGPATRDVGMGAGAAAGAAKGVGRVTEWEMDKLTGYYGVGDDKLIGYTRQRLCHMASCPRPSDTQEKSQTLGSKNYCSKL